MSFLFDSPIVLTRNVRYMLTDGDGGTSVAVDQVVNVACQRYPLLPFNGVSSKGGCSRRRRRRQPITSHRVWHAEPHLRFRTDPPLPDQRPPAGQPKDFREYAQLMCDIVALAFQTDRTRIATLLMSRVNAEREVQRLLAARPPIEKCSAPNSRWSYGDNHARDRHPNGRRQECSGTWRSGSRFAVAC